MPQDAKENGVPWEGQCINAADEFAARCVELRKSNPYPDTPVLRYVMPYLMTELWDHFFSQSEIRVAFEDTLANLSTYAAGQERRGEKR
jgi:hypothetical protein